MLPIFKNILYKLYDFVAAVFILLLLPVLWFTRRFRVENFPIQQKLFQWFGVFPIRNHYYEPKFVYEPGFDAAHDRDLPIMIDIPGQVQELQQFSDLAITELATLSLDQPQSPNGFFFNNPNFGPGDAELYYSLIRTKKPKRIIEVGSGFSTQLCLLALERNKAEGFEGSLACVEPFEMPFLDSLAGITVIRKQVENTPLDIFESLEENDILFIDSSHIIRPGNDLLFLYFQVLPRLKKGVLIHIHDIFTPRHYPQEWLTQKMRFWNEQYLLEAFLYNNDGFKILFTLNHLVKTEFVSAKNYLIHLKQDSEPSSFWMEKS